MTKRAARPSARAASIISVAKSRHEPRRDSSVCNGVWVPRALGLAARFVTGYLYVPDRDTGESHLGGGATHAWCQIYLPGAGWVEFDPTNGIVGSRDLIRVAVARDARQAIPLHGLYYGAAGALADMTVSVLVRKRAEAAV